MSFVSKIYNKAKDKVSSVVTSKNVAIVAPYMSAFTKSGRSALKDVYGGAAVGMANAYTGGKGGVFAQAAMDVISPDKPMGQPATVYTDEAPVADGQPSGAFRPSGAVNYVPWLVLGGVVVIAGVLILRR